MKNSAHFFEIQDLLTQFIAAFDDVVITRYNKQRDPKDEITVRYVLGPKQRVMHDIINKSDNITLPVISIELASVTRDEDRVFNKLSDTYLPHTLVDEPKRNLKIPPPVPVNLEINMSIISKYMNDADQILSNFVPYNNPYIIISWQVPDEYGDEYIQEIRSEVLWDGVINYDTPTTQTHADKYRLTQETSFTIKGWLFRPAEDPVGTIFKIDSNFHALDYKNKIYNWDNIDSIMDLYGDNDPLFTDVVTISATPTITNLFVTSENNSIANVKDDTIINSDINNTFMLYGKMFDRSNTFYLSSNSDDFYDNYMLIDTALSPEISGYRIDDSQVTIISDNIVSLNLPASSFEVSGNFTFVIANSAGWDTSFSASSSLFTIE